MKKTNSQREVEETEKPSYENASELFNELFTQSIIIDMPYDLFWHGEPSLYYNYLDAYEQKLEDKEKAFVHKENWKAWLQGLYIDHALACNQLFKKQQEEIKDSDELTKVEEQQAIAQFMAFGQLVGAMNNKRKENGN